MADQIEKWVIEKARFDPGLRPRQAELIAAARQLVEGATELADVLRLEQVASLDVEHPLSTTGGSVGRVMEALAAHGIPHGAQVSVLVAQASLQGLVVSPVRPDGALRRKFSVPAPVTGSGESVPPDLAKELQTLWWSQSLYSRSQDQSYRKLSGAALVYWMAYDLAELSPTHRHPGLECLLVEALRRLDVDVDETAPSLDRVRALVGVLRAASTSPPLPGALSALLDDDRTLLPISTTIKFASHVDLEEKVAGLLPEEVSVEDWAIQVFRERQLARWLEEE